MATSYNVNIADNSSYWLPESLVSGVTTFTGSSINGSYYNTGQWSGDYMEYVGFTLDQPSNFDIRLSWNDNDSSGVGFFLYDFARGWLDGGSWYNNTPSNDNYPYNSGIKIVKHEPLPAGQYAAVVFGYDGVNHDYQLKFSNAPVQTTQPVPAPSVGLFWCTRDLSWTGGGNHHFLWITGNPTAINNEDSFNGQEGFIIGATKINGMLEAYSTGDGSSTVAKETVANDKEAIMEHLTGKTIGWTNENFEMKQIPINRQSDSIATDLINAFNNYKQSSIDIAYDLGGADIFLGENSGNCASWVNTILQVVGLPLNDRFGDFSAIDWGEDHLVNQWAFA